MNSPQAPEYATPAAFLGALSHPSLTDLLINGTNETYADNGAGLVRIEHVCPNAAELENLARQLVALADRHIDFANPFADCVLTSAQLGLTGEATFRVHAVLTSATSKHTLISVRKHQARAIGLHEFLGGRLELELWLRGVLERRENFVISGATGSGKTTLLRSMMGLVGNDRVVAIEDTAELAPIAGHFVSLQTRQANTEGRGSVGLERLLLEALRMRPDRLLLGEVRGPELLTLLGALNTGHGGAGCTMHANSASQVATRIATIGLQAGWSPGAVAATCASALDWVIHVSRRGHARAVTGIGRFSLGLAGELQVASVPEVEKFL